MQARHGGKGVVEESHLPPPVNAGTILGNRVDKAQLGPQHPRRGQREEDEHHQGQHVAGEYDVPVEDVAGPVTEIEDDCCQGDDREEGHDVGPIHGHYQPPGVLNSPTLPAWFPEETEFLLQRHHLMSVVSCERDYVAENDLAGQHVDQIRNSGQHQLADVPEKAGRGRLTQPV